MNFEDVIKYNDEYLKNNDRELEKKIKKHGIYKASLNENLINHTKYKFNIKIPEAKIFDQKNTYRCNIYAFNRFLHSYALKNSKKFKDLYFSHTYIDFYDKYEKIRALYNDLFKLKNIDEDIINAKTTFYITMAGTFHSCRNIINKYGIVPIESMGETPKYNFFITIELLKDKLKADALQILNEKENRKELKEKLLKEAYIFLCKTIGLPPTKVKFDNHLLTPLEFKDLTIKSDLNDFISLTYLDPYIFCNSNSFIPNPYLEDNEILKQVSITKMKDAVIKQLKDGLSVWFSAEESTTLDYDYNILDPKIYNFNKLLNIKNVNKKNLVRLNIYEYNHAMSITGALVKNNEVIQFKVDNSFGNHGIYKGHCIMTKDFFENCIFTVIIDKKYLT